MNCEYCNEPLVDQDFCPNCGKKTPYDSKHHIEETLEAVEDKIKEDPLIVKPVLSSDESIDTILTDEIEEPLPTQTKRKFHTYRRGLLTYIREGIKAPFLSLSKVTEKDFPFTLLLFVLSLFVIPLTISLYIGRLFSLANSFFYSMGFGIYYGIGTFITIFLATTLFQLAIVGFFILLVKIQRTTTSWKVLFSRFVHLSLVSIMGYSFSFFLALTRSNLGLVTLLLFILLQVTLVPFLFFIEKRENRHLLDPVYNMLLYMIGILWILSLLGVEMFSLFY